MNHMKQITFLTAILLAFSACELRVEGTPFYKGQQVSLSATVPSNGGGEQQLPNKQRITGIDSHPSSSEGSINLSWEEGDQILVTVGKHAEPFTLVAGAGTAKATFIGQMPADGTAYDVTYPINYHDSLLYQQPYTPNGFSSGLMKMSTKTPGTLDHGFTLSADNALLGLQLIGDQPIGKIVLTNPADNQTYTLHSIHVTLSNLPTLFYIVVPAGEWKQGFKVDVYAIDNTTHLRSLTKATAITFSPIYATIMPTQSTMPYTKTYRYGFTQEQWDAAKSRWGHGGRGHAPLDQSCIQATMVHGIRLKILKSGILNVYKVPSLQEKTEENFEYVITLQTDKIGLQDFDFPQPIYIGPTEYLVFGKPSEEMPTLGPAYAPGKEWQRFTHFIGTEHTRNAGTALMVEFY